MRRYVKYVGDFETTVYEGQTKTEVWASAVVKIGCEDVRVDNCLLDTYNYLVGLNRDIIIYYHNLKFDGRFWLSFLMCGLKLKQALCSQDPPSFYSPDDMPCNTFSYCISNMGQWYSIRIKTVLGRVIEIRDSLKLIPLSVDSIGKSFATKHRKTSIEYTGVRKARGVITDIEREYIANDVLVVKEALEMVFKEGHNRLTIGSCCLEEFKRLLYTDYDTVFPNMYNISIDETIYGSKTAGEYIRRAYAGGWCYLVKGKEQKLYHNGCTCDVNSLYPSMMHSDSGNIYPIGQPVFWKGEIPAEALQHDKYYFVRIRTRFYIRSGYLPTIQLKRNYLYPQTEWLTSSDVYDFDTHTYNRYYDLGGRTYEARPVITLTCTDFELMKRHYTLKDCEILDGCYFNTVIGVFDDYINKYKHIKETSTGGRRQISKLYLNNLYGKMGSTTNSSFKFAELRGDGTIGFREVTEFNKIPGYIPIGAAITSYARHFTITAAQANYHGVDKPGFIYADTDSIHVDMPKTDIVSIHIHQTDFCKWKIETEWDIGFFVRQKTYIECADGVMDIKCAGLPERCKELLAHSMGYQQTTAKNESEEEFLKVKRCITDFTHGLDIPGKLVPKGIPGGVVLTETTYKMR